MKRFTSLVLVAMLLLSLCAIPAQAEEPIVLQFWGAIPPETGPQALVDNWNAANPDVQVEYTRFVNNDAGNTKLETAIMGGEVDVFINYPISALDKRVEAGLMIPLDDYLAADNFVLEDEFGASNFYRNGKCYFIPSNGGNEAYLMYNKDMLDAAGVVIPERWTWEEFEEVARKLTVGEGPNKVFGFSKGYSYKGDEWTMESNYSLGNDPMYKSATESNFDSPTYLRDLSRRYRMEMVDKSMINRLEMKMTNLDIASEFANGRVAILGANYHLRDMKNTEKYPHDFKIGFARWPMSEEQTTVTHNGIREWIAITPNCKHADKAWDFIKYYATEGFYPMCSSGRLPAWRGADPDKAVSYYLGDNAEQLFDTESFAKNVMGNPYAMPAVNIYSAAQNVFVTLMGEAYESVVLGEATPEEAIAILKVEADKALKNAQ